MIIVMKKSVNSDQIKNVSEKLKEKGFQVHLSKGVKGLLLEP